MTGSAPVRFSVALALMATLAATALAGAVPVSTLAAPARATADAGGRQTPASTSQTLVVDGATRSYLLFQPTAPASRPLPLVIALRGGFSTAAAMESLTGFDQIAQSRGFVVAYPEQLAGYWDIGCCNTAANSLDDIDFVSQIVHHLTATAGVDPSRVYVVGFSVGAALTYRLACVLSSQIAGIGSVGGFQYLTDPCRPKRPVSVVEIHGTTDYYGGSCGGQTQTDVGCGFGQPGYEPSVAQLNAQWRRFDGCPAPRTHADGGLIQLTASPCTEGTGVKLITIAGGGHCWPGSSQNSCTAFDASMALWTFLSAHHRSS
jgi:polyhydroxybutyrate depolymerase